MVDSIAAPRCISCYQQVLVISSSRSLNSMLIDSAIGFGCYKQIDQTSDCNELRRCPSRGGRDQRRASSRFSLSAYVAFVTEQSTPGHAGHGRTSTCLAAAGAKGSGHTVGGLRRRLDRRSVPSNGPLALNRTVTGRRPEDYPRGASDERVPTPGRPGRDSRLSPTPNTELSHRVDRNLDGIMAFQRRSVACAFEPVRR